MQSSRKRHSVLRRVANVFVVIVAALVLAAVVYVARRVVYWSNARSNADTLRLQFADARKTMSPELWTDYYEPLFVSPIRPTAASRPAVNDAPTVQDIASYFSGNVDLLLDDWAAWSPELGRLRDMPPPDGAMPLQGDIAKVPIWSLFPYLEEHDVISALLVDAVQQARVHGDPATAIADLLAALNLVSALSAGNTPGERERAARHLIAIDTVAMTLASSGDLGDGVQLRQRLQNASPALLDGWPGIVDQSVRSELQDSVWLCGNGWGFPEDALILEWGDLEICMQRVDQMRDLCRALDDETARAVLDTLAAFGTRTQNNSRPGSPQQLWTGWPYEVALRALARCDFALQYHQVALGALAHLQRDEDCRFVWETDSGTEEIVMTSMESLAKLRKLFLFMEPGTGHRKPRAD